MNDFLGLERNLGPIFILYYFILYILYLYYVTGDKVKILFCLNMLQIVKVLFENYLRQQIRGLKLAL